MKKLVIFSLFCFFGSFANAQSAGTFYPLHNELLKNIKIDIPKNLNANEIQNFKQIVFNGKLGKVVPWVGRATIGGAAIFAAIELCRANNTCSSKVNEWLTGSKTFTPYAFPPTYVLSGSDDVYTLVCVNRFYTSSGDLIEEGYYSNPRYGNAAYLMKMTNGKGIVGLSNGGTLPPAQCNASPSPYSVPPGFDSLPHTDQQAIKKALMEALRKNPLLLGLDAFPNLNQLNDNPLADPKLDTDSDGIADIDEVVAGTDPLLADTVIPKDKVKDHECKNYKFNFSDLIGKNVKCSEEHRKAAVNQCGNFHITRFFIHTREYLRDLIIPCHSLNWSNLLQPTALKNKFPFSVAHQIKLNALSVGDSPALPSSLGILPLDWDFLTHGLFPKIKALMGALLYIFFVLFVINKITPQVTL